MKTTTRVETTCRCTVWLTSKDILALLRKQGVKAPHNAEVYVMARYEGETYIDADTPVRVCWVEREESETTSPLLLLTPETKLRFKGWKKNDPEPNWEAVLEHGSSALRAKDPVVAHGMADGFLHLEHADVADYHAHERSAYCFGVLIGRLFRWIGRR